MTILQVILVLVAQTAQVGGQLLLKKGRSGPRTRLPLVIGGVALLTFWFLAWLKLLQGLDISYLYPFEGISLVLLVVAARVILHEQTSLQAWFGVALITGGIILVGLNY
jgi:multidrug transporter EmrE-like cation transporter